MKGSGLRFRYVSAFFRERLDATRRELGKLAEKTKGSLETIANIAKSPVKLLVVGVSVVLE